MSTPNYVVLDAGVPVGRIVYAFGAANGGPEGDAGVSGGHAVRHRRGVVRGDRGVGAFHRAR